LTPGSNPLGQAASVIPAGVLIERDHQNYLALAERGFILGDGRLTRRAHTRTTSHSLKSGT
jgi:hypothetical protein